MRIIRLDEPEGNPYAIFGICHNMLRQIWGRGEEGDAKIAEFDKEVEEGEMEEGDTRYQHLQKVAKKWLPSLIDFAHSDEIEVTETIVRRDDDWERECEVCGVRLNSEEAEECDEEDCPCS